MLFQNPRHINDVCYISVHTMPYYDINVKISLTIRFSFKFLLALNFMCCAFIKTFIAFSFIIWLHLMVVWPEMPTSYERKKYFWGWKTVFWLEKQYFSFCLHRSVHKVILEKKVFWGILLKITSICNLKKVLNTAKSNSWHLCLTHGFWY